MKQKRWSSVLGIILLFILITGEWMVTKGEVVTSVNIVGNSKSEKRTIVAQGELATLSGDSIPMVYGSRIPFILKYKVAIDGT